MKITHVERLFNKGTFGASDEFKTAISQVDTAIRAIENPIGSGKFFLFNEAKANGVTPIKNGFIDRLNKFGWKDEKIADLAIKSRKFDSTFRLKDGKYFAVEWETGNISSSHRALNRIVLGIHDGILHGGALVLPSREMYNYLTDRVGNYKELEPYFPVWRLVGQQIREGVLIVIEIEHDGVSNQVSRIPKGTDGRAKK